MLVFEALRAAHGDSLILHYGSKTQPRLAVIDGGPTGVYNDALLPRLEAIRKERKLAGHERLGIDLMMVSHIDDDHVVGILSLVGDMRDLIDAHRVVPWKITRFWHNSFDDVLGNNGVPAGAAGASGAQVASTAELAGFDGIGSFPDGGGAVMASVAQGRKLRLLLEALGLGGNPPFNGIIMGGQSTDKVPGLKIKIVAPGKAELTKLQTKWDKEIKPILAKEKKSAGEVQALIQFADYSDVSVHNLSSIVMLVEADGKRILLTGDGRGDHTLKGLKDAKLLDKNGKLEVDLLKMPHHGSIRNIDKDYLDTIIAKHYVISANGRDDNPDIPTLKMLSQSRKDDKFTVYLTYPKDEYLVPKVGKAVDAFFAAEKKKGRKYKVVVRKAGDLSVKIKLA